MKILDIFKKKKIKATHDHFLINQAYDFYQKNTEILINLLVLDFIDKYKCKFKLDDKVILNSYNQGYNSANKWDGGAASYHNILEQLPSKPIHGTVTKVSVNTSLIRERIDNLLDDLSVDDIFEYWATPSTKFIIDKLYSSEMPCNNIHGIYWNVYVDNINIKFQPEWGLNENSYIHVNTEYAKETNVRWALDEKITLLRTRLTELETEKSNWK